MRALGLALIWLMVLQPTVATAAIAQEPLFSVSALPPNVMLMMDDSNSMREYSLPLPPGIALPGLTCRSKGVGQPIDGVVVSTRIGNRCVHLDDDWALRSPALNPLWYNPAVTYSPWNDNNKAAAGSNFPQANWGGSTAVADPTQLTPWDMRKWPASVTPFYTPSATQVTTNTGTIGTNPQVVNPGAGQYIRYPGMPAGRTAERRSLHRKRRVHLQPVPDIQPGSDLRATTALPCLRAEPRVRTAASLPGLLSGAAIRSRSSLFGIRAGTCIGSATRVSGIRAGSSRNVLVGTRRRRRVWVPPSLFGNELCRWCLH